MSEKPQIAFETPDVEFRVNQDKRTISGLVIPWNQVATDAGGMAKWRFLEGSLHASEVGRVKLNLFHDRSRPIGKALRLVSTRDGLDGTFRIARGDEGDQVLTLAEDGVLDGFSIEPHFGDDDGWKADESDRSIRNVTSARLSMVGLVPAPAFDDARVANVNLQLPKGPKMSEKTENKIPEEVEAQLAEFQKRLDEAEPATFDADAFNEAISNVVTKVVETQENLAETFGESVAASMSEGMRLALEQMGGKPEPVNAARYSINRDDPVYRFDGRGESMIRDAWYAQREQDEDAIERLRNFRVQQTELEKLVVDHIAFEAANRLQFATVTTTTAADVIPPGYRPDLFVPELNQGRPLAGLLSRGSISNATPFTVPTFVSATGVTADHAEGSPPAEGTLTLGSETVSPVAVSGKLPLTREIIDSANPAIDQIALSAMRESYSQQTETKIYTALNGAAAAANTETFAATSAGAGAVYDARSLLARYPFTRFASPSGAAMNQKVTEDFANALDANNRPLLPSIGAQNSSGLGNAVTQGWFLDGLPFVPAWAITDGVGDDVALIVNRADAWYWESSILSFRFEEKQGPEIIELALFGYFGTQVLRAAGIFALRNP